MCTTLIILGSASCLRTIQAAWPSSHASYRGSTNPLYSSSIGKDNSVPEEKDNSVSEDEAVCLYKDALLFALDHSVTFAKQLKERVEQCIMQLTRDVVVALQGARIGHTEF
ncbi:hypothetical protein [Cardinium endosymbiont of Sogatella furcifera]|uniref:hypothetical protein n=1 Tax=Cardinium endosymbiont of Sogatella furcifera TaxID=650378 RepID=UPI000E0D6A64|nr:hypothetical protein [Cardinium endosymbiont of Sogatella furcifera]